MGRVFFRQQLSRLFYLEPVKFLDSLPHRRVCFNPRPRDEYRAVSDRFTHELKPPPNVELRHRVTD